MTIQNGRAAPARGCAQAGGRGNPLRWDLSPPEIRAVTEGLMSRVKKVYDEIGALKMESVSVENTLKALASVKMDYACKCFKENSVLLSLKKSQETTVNSDFILIIDYIKTVSLCHIKIYNLYQNFPYTIGLGSKNR